MSGSAMRNWVVRGVLAAALTACGPKEFRITMAELNSSGQSGIATVLDYGDRFTVQFEVAPHPVETGPQLIHIHPGRCGNIGNPILSLNSMENGESFTDIPGSFDDYRGEDHAFNGHLSSDPSVYVVCGNIPRL